jgi:hypothetical protein
LRKNTVLLTTAFAGAFAFEMWVTFGPPGDIHQTDQATFNQCIRCRFQQDLGQLEPGRMSPLLYFAILLYRCTGAFAIPGRTHANPHFFTQRQWKDIKQRYMVKEEEDDE